MFQRTVRVRNHFQKSQPPISNLLADKSNVSLSLIEAASVRERVDLYLGATNSLVVAYSIGYTGGDDVISTVYDMVDDIVEKTH